MDRAQFEVQCRQQGYAEILERRMEPGVVNPTHTHDFDAQLFIIGGEMTIARGDGSRTYRAGDTCDVPAGTSHEERVGPAGVHYLAGRRHKTAAAG